MIQHRFFPAEPWVVRETELDLSVLAQTESIFALSNGHIGLRANLEEGEPHGLPGTYLNSFYETHPLLHSEPGYGYTDVGQTLVNVTNGKIIRLLVDDESFDVRYGRLRAHERILDMRAGVLRRQAEWVSPAEQAVRLSSVRLVSFAQRAVAAILYEVEALGAPARLVVQSELVANEPLPAAPALGWARRCVPSSSPTTTPGSCSSTPRKRAACGWPRPWTTSSRGRQPHRLPRRAARISGG
jgi:alpha,alpha-trehalose phosphorylase